MLAFILILAFVLFAVLCLLMVLSFLVTLAVGTALKLAGKPFDADKVSERVLRILAVIAFVVPVSAGLGYGLGYGLYSLYREYGTNVVWFVVAILASAGAGFGLSRWAKWVWKE